MFKTTVIGRLSKDPEYKILNNGNPCLIIDVIANNGYMSSNGWVDQLSNVRMSLFGPRAKRAYENSTYMQGFQIHAECLSNDTMYMKGNQKVYTVNHNVSEIRLLSQTQEHIQARQQQRNNNHSNQNLQTEDTPY